MNYTKGPWSWEANAKTGQVQLLTEGRGRVFVMAFYRHGMQGAQPAFQAHKEDCDGACRGCGHMVPLFEAGYPTDHNGYFDIDHPDARLIAAAPDLLEACKALLRCVKGSPDDHTLDVAVSAEYAIAKAEGRP